MQLTIDSVSPSKSGKSLRVKSGNDWYGADKKSGLQAGMTVEAAISTGDFGDWIDSWKPVEGKAGGSVGSTNGVAKGAWWMPFVSNTVAHAIQAGLIKEPAQVGSWAKIAMTTAIALEDIEPGSEG